MSEQPKQKPKSLPKEILRRRAQQAAQLAAASRLQQQARKVPQHQPHVRKGTGHR